MFKDIFLTIIQLIISPQLAWREIVSKEEDNHQFLNKFLFPVFGIIALASFIGGLWFTENGSLEIALKKTIVNIITVYGGYIISAYMLNEVAPRFSIEKQLFAFQRFVGYASVVMYSLYIILSFISGFFILWVSAFYTFYIVYAGSKEYFKIQEKSRSNFTVIATLVILLVPGVINAILMFLVKTR